ncbi:hypothetical protein [Sphaerobacter sp.]|uniref:hypothetical protein n=1 Tax=Sphaerobacter sp. TaxID=2099654 RepID=UPI001D9AE1DE|nr:hypothetical protein [Sphaerobacter sp.]MBX5446628.1 hypothetical protein [Sphaerobacter sp.]
MTNKEAAMRPPENKRGGGRPSQERRPNTTTADHHTARANSIVGPDAVTGTASTARRRYAHAVELCRAAIIERAQAAAALAADPGNAEDYLALAHGQLVAEVTAILSREARRHSTARRLTTALTSRRRM